MLSRGDCTSASGASSLRREAYRQGSSSPALLLVRIVPCCLVPGNCLAVRPERDNGHLFRLSPSPHMAGMPGQCFCAHERGDLENRWGQMMVAAGGFEPSTLRV